MKFNFENFGFIDHGTLELGDLTIISGPNNVGKTYISYAMHGWGLEAYQFDAFDIPDALLEKLYNDGVITIDLSTYAENLPQYLESISQAFNNKIASFFSVHERFFDKTKVAVLPEGLYCDFKEEINNTIHVGTNNEIVYRKPQNSKELSIAYISKNNENSKDSIPKFMLLSFIKQIIKVCLITPLFKPTFPITSERTGVTLFQKQLDHSLSLGSSSSDFNAPLNNTRASLFNYVEPIIYNLNLTRSFETISKQKSFISSEPKYQGLLDALSDLMKGTCKVINNHLVYISRVDPTREDVHIPIHMASSSIKSLALIELYIRSISRKGDVLLIDEPELNLHLNNQAKMAGIIARLVNAGVKVLITTHSDTILREINNRIMLSLDVNDKDRIMHDANISHDEILSASSVRAYYMNSNHILQQAQINKYGIDFTEMDEIIQNTNAVSDEIFYNIR